jgi:hypothetical protein
MHLLLQRWVEVCAGQVAVLLAAGEGRLSMALILYAVTAAVQGSMHAA